MFFEPTGTIICWGSHTCPGPGAEFPTTLRGPQSSFPLVGRLLLSPLSLDVCFLLASSLPFLRFSAPLMGSPSLFCSFDGIPGLCLLFVLILHTVPGPLSYEHGLNHHLFAAYAHIFSSAWSLPDHPESFHLLPTDAPRASLTCTCPGP